MRTADVIVLGGGIIGLSLALELRAQHYSVLQLERREPGLEASHAAAGMLVAGGEEGPAAFHALAAASAGMYPDFVETVEEASGMKVDLRSQGTILLGNGHGCEAEGRALSAAETAKLEPELRAEGGARFIEERSVDPRALAQACTQAARAHGAHIASGEEAVAVEKSGSGLTVATKKSRYEARYVVNCCGAWSGQIDPYRWPTRPVKGQILCVLPEKKDAVRHVLRSGEVYVVPRSDGRVLIGSTMEEAGFDKSVQVETIQGLRAKAAKLAPALGEAKMHDAWAGLRPALPDGLPILSGTPLAGYFVATGHLRDGILLAPVTARVMTAMVSGKPAGFDLEPFRAARFLPPS